MEDLHAADLEEWMSPPNPHSVLLANPYYPGFVNLLLRDNELLEYLTLKDIVNLLTSLGFMTYNKVHEEISRSILDRYTFPDHTPLSWAAKYQVIMRTVRLDNIDELHHVFRLRPDCIYQLIINLIPGSYTGGLNSPYAMEIPQELLNPEVFSQVEMVIIEDCCEDNTVLSFLELVLPILKVLKVLDMKNFILIPDYFVEQLIESNFQLTSLLIAGYLKPEEQLTIVQQFPDLYKWFLADRTPADFHTLERCENVRILYVGHLEYCDDYACDDYSVFIPVFGMPNLEEVYVPDGEVELLAFLREHTPPSIAIKIW